MRIKQRAFPHPVVGNGDDVNASMHLVVDSDPYSVVLRMVKQVTLEQPLCTLSMDLFARFIQWYLFLKPGWLW